MNFEEFRGVLKRIKYKEGWTIQAKQGPLGSNLFAFQVSWKAPDSTGRRTQYLGGQPMTISSKDVYLENFWNEDAIVKQVLEEIISCEVHEAQEFFKFDGVRVFNPHALVKNRAQIADYEGWDEVVKVQPPERHYWQSAATTPTTKGKEWVEMQHGIDFKK